jgi:hypothetical protein
MPLAPFPDPLWIKLQWCAFRNDDTILTAPLLVRNESRAILCIIIAQLFRDGRYNFRVQDDTQDPVVRLVLYAPVHDNLSEQIFLERRTCNTTAPVQKMFNTEQ